MTKSYIFTPMSKRIVFLFSDEVQPIDVAGPASAFAQANECAARADFYTMEFASPHGGPVTSFSGLPLHTQSVAEIAPENIDTLLIGGHKPLGTQKLIGETRAKDWFTEASATARRWGSVCGGAYILAAWGLVDGCRIASHWRSTRRIAADFPAVNVDNDALYVTDGRLWTSAGVTAGIDMALAMIEEDLGADIAAAVARHLVVYMRRPGSQSQFSEPLKRQTNAAAPYADLINWAKANLSASLTVDQLADRAGQSLRTFQRKFREHTGQTPAVFIEDLRLDRAKALITSQVSLKSVAREVGYASASQLTLVFQRRYGVAPSMWKTMHGNMGNIDKQ